MFTDMHNHFVYGVDDGCQSREAMLSLLKALQTDRVTAVISTPHIIPGQQHFEMDDYLEHFAEAETLVRDNGLQLKLYTGNEILYTDNTPRYLREGRALTLAGSDSVLIEFMPGEKFERLCEAAQKILNAGYEPVYAHIERYVALADTKNVAELKQRYNIRMQVNSSTFVRRQGLIRRHWLKKLMHEELIDFVSTDTHDMPGREPCMRACHEILTRDYGAEAADWLTCRHASTLLPDGE